MQIDLFGKKRYKVNLHMHTADTDGRKTEAEALDIYLANGYDAVAVTDHWISKFGGTHKGMTVLSGGEYNTSYRDCMDGAGMRNFTVFSFFTFLAIGALVLLPYLGIGVVEGASKLNSKLAIATGIAFVAFLLDCIVKSGGRGSYDDLDMESYFKGDSGRYNNTII